MSEKKNTCCEPSTGCILPSMSEQPLGIDAFDAEEFATYAKALGHPARVAIMRLLLTKENCVCGEIVDELPLAQSTVSQHLKQLKAAGLIRGEIDGPRVCYCVEPQAMARFKLLTKLFI